MTNFNEHTQQRVKRANYYQQDIPKERREKAHHDSRHSYINIDELAQVDEDSSGEQLDDSSEVDGQWKPHLSWSYISWSHRNKMEEQAAQRELAWKKIADKLGPLMISETGNLLGHKDHLAQSHLTDERAYERVPFISHNLSNSACSRHYLGRSRSGVNQCKSHLRDKHSNTGDRFTLNGRCESEGSPCSLPSSIGTTSPNETDDADDSYGVKQNYISDYGGLTSSKFSSAAGRVSKNCSDSNIGTLSTNVGGARKSHESGLGDVGKKNGGLDTYAFLDGHTVSNYSLLRDGHENDSATLSEHNREYAAEVSHFKKHKRAKRRCLLVSGTIISLMLLLFIIILLMAFKVLDHK